MLSVLACGAVGMETLPYFLVLKGSCADVDQHLLKITQEYMGCALAAPPHPSHHHHPHPHKALYLLTCEP